MPTDHTKQRVPSLGVHVDNPSAAAGWVRSPRWKRSAQYLPHSAKADPPPSFLSGAGPIPNQKYASGAGWVRSPRWKRSPSPLVHSAKAEPPPSFLAGAGPIPRSPNRPHTAASPSLATYANSPLITSPAMSVSRKSRPSKRCVKRVCSMPKRCSIVACKSCTFTGFSTML